MMKIALKILNYSGYLIGCNQLGNWFGKLYWSLFPFVKDETYAEEHPKAYVAKVVGLMVLGILIALAIIWYPLTKGMEWINNMIDKHFDKHEEDDDFLD